MSGYVPPRSVPSGSPTFPAPSGPTGAYGSLGGGRGSHSGFQESRKRSYNDRQENGNGADPHYARGDRHIKQMRRGGGSSRADGFGSRGGRGGFQESKFPHAGSPLAPTSFLNISVPPQGLPFDNNDPFAAIMAMQAMGLPPLPGQPQLPQAGSPNVYPPIGGQSSPSLDMMRRSNIRERCRDYDTQGYCTRGDACPYEHGTDRVIVPSQDGTVDLFEKRTRLIV